jgi:predicted enzyme related to lactoylglutathione lyase
MTTTAAPSQILGRHIWSELITTDVKAAEAFYDAVVGWSSAPMAGGAMPYTQFKRGDGTGVAGLMERPHDMHVPPFWSMYIAVPDFASAAAQIRRLGGTEMSGVIDIPSVGRIQMLKDPQGAAFYIMQPEPSATPRDDRAPDVGEASWLELATTDLSGAIEFYRQVFGWQPTDAMDMGEMGKYQMFNRGERMMGGMMTKPPQMAELPSHWAIYFLVPDIDAAVERVKANGGAILNGPMEVPGGDRIANGLDPQGAAFSLHARHA